MSIFKKIGKVLTAPARAIGHAAATSGIPLVSNAGRAVEKVGDAFAGKGAFFRDLGQAGKAAAPVVALVPGVGPFAAGALGAGGELLDKGRNAKLSDIIKAGAIPAAESYLLGGQGYKGVGGAVDKIKSLATNTAAGKGVLGKIGTYVRKHPLDAAQIALAGAGTVQGAQRGGQADRLRSDALAGLDVNPTIDLGELGPDAYSPYARKLPRRAPLAALTSGGY